MSLAINTVFHTDFVHALGIDGGEVCEEVLQNFLRTYFSPSLSEKIFSDILGDTTVFRKSDPASSEYSTAQILSVRRGMAAIAAHRIFSVALQSDFLSVYELEVLAKYVQKDTNVEIHPQATLGKNFAIDHGHGTVIGATVSIGDDVWIYHGVTLGATGKQSPDGRRHPKVGGHCYFGNGSQVLGPSDIGKNCALAAGSIVADSCLGEGVSVFLGVKIFGVCIPAHTKIFSSDQENPARYWVQAKGENNAKWVEFPKFKECCFP